MPLSIDNFPSDFDAFVQMILDRDGIYEAPGGNGAELERGLEVFYLDSVGQLIPLNDVSGYCRGVAMLINNVLYEHVEDVQPEMWRVAVDLLRRAGLRPVGSPPSLNTFYNYAGKGKPPSPLSNNVFVGHWH